MKVYYTKLEHLNGQKITKKQIRELKISSKDIEDKNGYFKIDDIQMCLGDYGSRSTVIGNTMYIIGRNRQELLKRVYQELRARLRGAIDSELDLNEKLRSIVNRIESNNNRKNHILEVIQYFNELYG